MAVALSRKRDILIFLLPGLLLYTAIVFFPIFTTVYYSFLEWDFSSTTKSFVGLQNFTKVFSDPIFIKTIRNSIAILGGKLLVELPIALLVALVLAWGVRGEKAFRIIYFLPTILSPVVIAQLFRHFYEDRFGELNNILRAVGLESWTRYWLADENTALISVIVMMVWRVLGYGLLIYYAAIKNIPEELYESARIDGAGFWKSQTRITIPLIRSAIRTTVILATVAAFKSFDDIYILTPNGGPNFSTEVPASYMYKTMFFKSNYGTGSVVAFFIILECVVVTVFLMRLLRSQEVTY